MPHPTCTAHAPSTALRPVPPVSSQAEEIQLASITFVALMMTTTFSQTAADGAFKGVQPLDWTSIAAPAALTYMCQRLAMARRLTTTPSPVAAKTYKDRIAAIWRHHGTSALRCGAPLLAAAQHGRA